MVKTIYVAIRDFMRFFPSSGQGGDLKRVVLVPFGPGQDHRLRHGRVEPRRSASSSRDDAVAVYLPMSYMVGGYTVFLPRELLEPTALSVEAGMRIALMGGVQGARVPDGARAGAGSLSAERHRRSRSPPSRRTARSSGASAPAPVR